MFNEESTVFKIISDEDFESISLQCNKSVVFSC